MMPALPQVTSRARLEALQAVECLDLPWDLSRRLAVVDSAADACILGGESGAFDLLIEVGLAPAEARHVALVMRRGLQG